MNTCENPACRLMVWGVVWLPYHGSYCLLGLHEAPNVYGRDAPETPMADIATRCLVGSHDRVARSPDACVGGKERAVCHEAKRRARAKHGVEVEAETVKPKQVDA